MLMCSNRVSNLNDSCLSDYVFYASMHKPYAIITYEYLCLEIDVVPEKSWDRLQLSKSTNSCPGVPQPLT